MGFSEEPGIIPRFCEDLFAEIAKKQTQEVCSDGLCKPSYLSREQADRVKVGAVATEADSADGARSGPWALGRGWGGSIREAKGVCVSFSQNLHTRGPLFPSVCWVLSNPCPPSFLLPLALPQTPGGRAPEWGA